VVEIDSTTKATGHRARSARSVIKHLPETNLGKEPDQKIIMEKTIQIDKQIKDISEEKKKGRKGKTNKKKKTRVIKKENEKLKKTF
jgi:hypothetical protein